MKEMKLPIALQLKIAEYIEMEKPQRRYCCMWLFPPEWIDALWELFPCIPGRQFRQAMTRKY